MDYQFRGTLKSCGRNKQWRFSLHDGLPRLEKSGRIFDGGGESLVGAGDPYKALKTTLKAEINEEAWSTLRSDTSRPFDRPSSGRIAVKVINHLGDEVMKVFRV